MPLTSRKTCLSHGWLSVLSQRASVQTEPWCQSPQCPKEWWVSTEWSVPFPLSLSVAPAVFYRAASFTRTPHREEGNAQGRAVSADQSGEISQKSVCVCVCVGGGGLWEKDKTHKESDYELSEMEPHDLKHSAQALSQVFHLAPLAIDYSRVMLS